MLYLAGFILAMHSLLPHVHHDEFSEAEHQEAFLSADSLLDYVKLIFQIDMGEGHLENFETGQGLDFDINYPTDNSPHLPYFLEPIFLNTNEAIFISNAHCFRKVPIPDPPHYNSFSLRGPPSIS